MMNRNTEKPQSKHKNINWSKVKQKNRNNKASSYLSRKLLSKYHSMMNINTATQKNYTNTWSKGKTGKEERNGKQQTNMILSLPINIEQTKNTEIHRNNKASSYLWRKLLTKYHSMMNINTATQKKYRNTWSKGKTWKEERNGKQQTKYKNTTSSTFICETSFHSKLPRSNQGEGLQWKWKLVKSVSDAFKTMQNYEITKPK